MKTVLVGDGRRASEVLAALQSHPGVTVGARVAGQHPQAGVPFFPTLQAALGSFAPDLVVLTGEFAAADVLSTVKIRCPVLIAEAGTLSATAVAAVQQLAADDEAKVFLVRDSGYGAGGAVRRFVASGRLGPIGHLSCEDHRAGAAGAGEGARYWLSRGGPVLAQVCALLDTGTSNVMARVDDEHGVTEAYLETLSGVHVHYSANWRAAVESHCLWIEGVKGSLKTDGARVWWRKRGWHFFVPVRLGVARGAPSLRSALGRVVARIERGGGGSDDRQALRIAGAALASAASRQVVSFANPGRAAAA